MSTRGKIKQYITVLDMLKKKDSSSKLLLEGLKTYGFPISKRTLQRIIEELKTEFDLVIEYDTHQNVYSLGQDNGVKKIDTLIRLFENARTADALLNLIKDNKHGLRYLSPQSSELLQGFDQLSVFLNAIVDKRVIEFEHKNFKKASLKKHTLQPYMLKEYLYRWYIVGNHPETNKPVIFGIDRITNLTITKDRYKPDPHFPYDILFENIIGLDFSKGQVEKIVLAVHPIDAKYIESFPLHPSQKTMAKNKEKTIIELSLIPNYELTQQILRLGNRVEVIEPASLRQEIRKILTESLKQYQ